jgi:RNase P/RNase MRP subunit p29
MSRIGLVVALTLVAIGAGLALAGAHSSASADDSTPKGQMTRRGLSGTVVAIDGTSIVVETQFGNVTVETEDATITFRGPAPDPEETTRVIRVKDRVGILLDRSPVAATSTPISVGDEDEGDPAASSTPISVGGQDEGDPAASSTPISIGGQDEGDPAASSTPISVGGQDGAAATSTPPVIPSDDVPEPVAASFRDVKALQISVIPKKATRSHQRGVVKSKGNGKIKILKADGTEEEFDGSSGEVGDDLIFIVKAGRGGGPKTITNTVSEDEIIDRLDALALAAEDNPDLADGLAKLRGKVNEKRLERLEALVESSDPDDRDLINGALTKARGKSENKGSGNSDDGDDSGSDKPGGGNSASGGNSGSSKGNSGNSGGGNSGNSGGQGGGPKK